MRSLLPELQEQVLSQSPHLAFVLECLGLASLAGSSPVQAIMDRLDRCLQMLVARYCPPGAPLDPLGRWLDLALQEFRNLPEGELPALLSACAGNTMPEWLRAKVKAELGDGVTELITTCLEC